MRSLFVLVLRNQEIKLRKMYFRITIIRIFPSSKKRRKSCCRVPKGKKERKKAKENTLESLYIYLFIQNYQVMPKTKKRFITFTYPHEKRPIHANKYNLFFIKVNNLIKKPNTNQNTAFKNTKTHIFKDSNTTSAFTSSSHLNTALILATFPYYLTATLKPPINNPKESLRFPGHGMHYQ